MPILKVRLHRKEPVVRGTMTFYFERLRSRDRDSMSGITRNSSDDAPIERAGGSTPRRPGSPT